MPRSWEMPPEPRWPSGLDAGAPCAVPPFVPIEVANASLAALAADLVWQHPTMFKGWDGYGVEISWTLSDPDDLIRYDHMTRRISLSAIEAGATGMTNRQARSVLFLAMLAAVESLQRRRRRIRRVVADPPELAAGQRSLFDA